MSSFPFSSPVSHPVCDFFDIPSFITSSSSSVVSFCLNHPFSSFPCEECPVSPLPHQWDRTMGPIFSPGFSPPITVPARFFPMAEHKTSSRLLGTNPLHPGFSNGLEGAMRLAVYPFQLERSPSLSLSFHTLIFPSKGWVIWYISEYTITFLPRATSLGLLTALSHFHLLVFSYRWDLQIHQPLWFNWGCSVVQIDTRGSSGVYRKQTWLTNAFAAILPCPCKACELLSVTQKLCRNIQGQINQPCDTSVTTSSQCDKHTASSCTSFLCLHAASDLVRVRSAGTLNKDIVYEWT